MRCFFRHNEKGFTLLEVSFAATILAIGIMGYTLLKSSNRYSRQYAMETAKAIQLSGGQLEEFMMTNYDSGFLTAGTHTHAGTMPRIGDFQLTNAQWFVRNGCPSQFAKTIDFEATWGTGAAAKTLTLTHVMVDR